MAQFIYDDTELTAVEQELTESVKFEAKSKYKTRQDYLADLGKAVNKIEDADYEKLSDPAVEWMQSALPAIKAGDTIPDFPDYEAKEGDDAPGEEAGDGEGEGEEAGDGENSEQEETPPARGRQRQQAAAPAKGRGKPDKKAAAKAPATSKGGKGTAKTGGPKRLFNDNRKRDRFGLVVGSKVAKAVALFAGGKGATMRQVIDSTGGPQNNVLKKLADAGHQVERFGGNVIKVTHKDDIKSGAKGKR